MLAIPGSDFVSDTTSMSVSALVSIGLNRFSEAGISPEEERPRFREGTGGKEIGICAS
jgi:hypothetical protein